MSVLKRIRMNPNDLQRLVGLLPKSTGGSVDVYGDIELVREPYIPHSLMMREWSDGWYDLVRVEW